ncbi:hypothetical protein KO525_06800 [Psychrosphaera sp. B3R10]|uniref:Uncharacterized protein n=1 Tax=Psychrosphaera algicola TaxID=3023714 RepID=A0ABT5F973_9GAMM|nr:MULTISPECIES: hypothetical protein [unclassified Psychrosphaera]MBU2882406.1 hypothetical protein [Psychrosphaera sp. I2R16]MBU2989087.1 hypothetical protein [Psychrosphaera sp. B3R10]MDC2887966.1 hypothetical protein [Psychrosphaera sp. G1-22]MDO6718083.1 hypothetical protein [Psychrosphaera sp. 1_MG-2023]
MNKKQPLSNAEKQKRYRERKILQGRKEVRGYLTNEAQVCLEEIRIKTGWDDSTILSNAIRLTFAAQQCGQVKLLNSWLVKHKK